MTDELKDQRIPIMMTPTEVRAIDDWAFSRRIRSRAAAIRQLVSAGLAVPLYRDMVDVAYKLGSRTLATASTPEDFELIGEYAKAVTNLKVALEVHADRMDRILEAHTKSVIREVELLAKGEKPEDEELSKAIQETVREHSQRESKPTVAKQAPMNTKDLGRP